MSRRPAAVVAVPTPADFSFVAVVAAHGWHQLAPYRFDDATRTLRATWRLAGRPLGLVFEEDDGALKATPSRRLFPLEAALLAKRVRYAFALDAPASDLHRVCRREASLRWIATRRLGRFLRGEDVFEDALKTLLTTNCTWTQTRAMVRNLVAVAGAPAADAEGPAFPSPEAVMALGERRLVAEAKTGYRARAALELAERAVDGGLDDLPTRAPEEARAEILGWRGFGPYAASALLQLFGTNAEPVVDSWALAQARKLGIGGRRPTAAHLRRHYARYGPEAARVAWFDLNRDHYAEWPPRFTTPDAAPAKAVSAAGASAPPKRSSGARARRR